MLLLWPCLTYSIICRNSSNWRLQAINSFKIDIHHCSFRVLMNMQENESYKTKGFLRITSFHVNSIDLRCLCLYWEDRPVFQRFAYCLYLVKFCKLWWLIFVSCFEGIFVMKIFTCNFLDFDLTWCTKGTSLRTIYFTEFGVNDVICLSVVFLSHVFAG